MKEEIENYEINICSLETPIECSICYESTEKNEIFAKTICDHSFHIDCISKWIKIKRNCPYCRKEIKKNIYFTNRKYKNIEIIEENDNKYFVTLFYGNSIEFDIIEKSDVDLILTQVNEESVLVILYFFIKNNKDIVDTIMEIIN